MFPTYVPFFWFFSALTKPFFANRDLCALRASFVAGLCFDLTSLTILFALERIFERKELKWVSYLKYKPYVKQEWPF